MKKLSGDLKSEVSELVEQVTVEEAQDEVLTKLQTAFESLDPKSQEVLQSYFNGIPLEELSRRHAISLPQTKDWIQQIKRTLISQLQRSSSARH